MSTASNAAAVLNGLPEIRSWQETLYRDIHQHPELSHHEHRTASLAADRLRRSGYDVRDSIGGTGVVGVLRNGTGPTVLLRADMDALPVQEATGLPYASTVRATDAAGNDVPVMHACGHDVHVTCLLGATALFADATQHWSGTAIALFQPAEEVGDGARGMIDDRLADAIPPPDVALAQHVLPAPAGHVGTSHSAPGRIRTCDTGFRRAVLYPLSYEGLTRSELTESGSLRPHSATRTMCPLAGAQSG